MTALRVFTSALLALASSGLAWAQPSLTTIRDTVYRADGTPFDGIAIIEWRSFSAPNQANVGQQGLTVRIVAGALFVKLAPTTASSTNYYLVRYNSNGQFQFSEIWSVPSTAAILRLRDVRANLLPGGIVVGGGAGGIIIGNTGGGGGFADGETPGGAVNGSNNAFTLAATPVPSTSLALYRNGLLQSPTVDYTLSGAVLTFNAGSIPQTGDVLRAFYRSGSGDSGTTAAHALLSATHSDTTANAPLRGSLIVGQGSTPAWGRLALGSANRCLVSNGTDAVWNTCLFTGFAANTIAFTGAGGVLSENSSALLWNNANRKMTVGNNLSTRATLYVYDDRTSSAVTELLVRAGANQGATPLQQWFANNGDAVAWVNADGGFNIRRILANSTSLRASITDTGTLTDPIPSAANNGDFWFNRTVNAWKTREAGQTHVAPQVVCSSAGATASASGTVGTCTIPAGLLLNGDRLVVEANYLRTGGSDGYTVEAKLGSTTLTTQTLASNEASVALRISAGFSDTQIAWSTTATRPTAIGGSTGSASFTPGTGAQIQLNASFTAGGATVRLQNFTVTRFPAQSNP